MNHLQPNPAPMADTWAMQSQFVLSPDGAGSDCHRTWEALLLGCVPVVKAAKVTKSKTLVQSEIN